MPSALERLSFEIHTVWFDKGDTTLGKVNTTAVLLLSPGSLWLHAQPERQCAFYGSRVTYLSACAKPIDILRDGVYTKLGINIEG